MSTIKGEALPDPALRGQFRVSFIGMPPIYATKFTGLEFEIETTDLADRTRHSAGATGAGEAVCSGYLHHTIEAVAWEAWFDASRNGSPGYKRDGTLEILGADGIPRAIYSLVGVWPKKWAIGDFDKTSKDSVEVAFTLSIDDRIKLL